LNQFGENGFDFAVLLRQEYAQQNRELQVKQDLGGCQTQARVA
jgi:hypothetical protein